MVEQIGCWKDMKMGLGVEAVLTAGGGWVGAIAIGRQATAVLLRTNTVPVLPESREWRMGLCCWPLRHAPYIIQAEQK
jgi:hypothetical protein